MIANRRRVLWIGALFCIAVLSALGLPAVADAHAILVNAEPMSNGNLATSPAQVKLEFNEKIEKELFELEVLNRTGNSVTDEKPQMNDDGNGMSLRLPTLAEGYYTVSYKVVSTDSHVVRSSYVFTVGNPPKEDAPKGLVSVNPSEPTEVLSREMTTADGLRLLSRILNYLALLVLTGWIGLRFILRVSSSDVLESYQKWALGLQRLFLITLLILIYFEFEQLLGENIFSHFSDGGLTQLVDLFSGTRIGLSWLAWIGLSLVGFVVLFRFAWFDVLWIIAMLAVKSQSGHAAATPPQALNIALDFVHLAASALWAGGIVWVVAFWRKHRDIAEQNLQVFSRAALLSIIVLVATGTIMTLVYLPSLHYLFYSQWGILLVIKVAVVVVVMFVGGFLRLRLKKRAFHKIGSLVKLDLSLMVIIVAIVGIFTTAAPIPMNEPLHWHEMGATIHMTTDITPKAAGINRFDVIVWLPDDSGAPRQVELYMESKQKRDVAPIQIPLTLVDDDLDEQDFIGFIKYSYTSEGPYIPWAGDWEIQVWILDAGYNDTAYAKQIRVY